MLAMGLPRALVLVLFLISYMSNIEAWQRVLP